MPSLNKQRGFWNYALPAAASLLGGVLGNKASAKQQDDQQAFNQVEAQKTRDFQADQSATAHQREVKDLRAAGLNPILSGTGGMGSSTPVGATASSGIAAQHDPITPAVSSALQASIQRSQSDLLEAQAATEVQRARIEKTKADAISAVGEKGQPYLQKGLDTIDQAIQGAGNNLSGAVSSAYSAVEEPVRRNLQSAIDFVQKLPNKVKEALLNSARSGYEYSTKKNPKPWASAKPAPSARDTMGTPRNRGPVPSRSWE